MFRFEAIVGRTPSAESNLILILPLLSSDKNVICDHMQHAATLLSLDTKTAVTTLHSGYQQQSSHVDIRLFVEPCSTPTKDNKSDSPPARSLM